MLHSAALSIPSNSLSVLQRLWKYLNLKKKRMSSIKDVDVDLLVSALISISWSVCDIRETCSQECPCFPDLMISEQKAFLLASIMLGVLDERRGAFVKGHVCVGLAGRGVRGVLPWLFLSLHCTGCESRGSHLIHRKITGWQVTVALETERG